MRKREKERQGEGSWGKAVGGLPEAQRRRNTLRAFDAGAGTEELRWAEIAGMAIDLFLLREKVEGRRSQAVEAAAASYERQRTVVGGERSKTAYGKFEFARCSEPPPPSLLSQLDQTS
jgi:hypothetical protein